ncbi:MAG TPA: N-acetyltransferase [Solibacterales bacterium]|nr:N-acetyltransferase [Bryobacterales bacterium]
MSGLIPVETLSNPPVQSEGPMPAFAGTARARKATMQDIPELLRLINGFAGKGIMLPRTEFEMSENIRDFVVLISDSRVVACGALHFYSPTMAEVRSLAVDPGAQSSGLGRQVVEALIADARQFDLTAVFAFTYVTGFFRKLGFREVDRDELPLKAWKDCLRCPKFQCCDETAVVLELKPRPPEKLLKKSTPEAPLPRVLK